MLKKRANSYYHSKGTLQIALHDRELALMKFTFLPRTLARVLIQFRQFFSKPQWSHFFQSILAIMIGHGRTDLTALTELRKKARKTRTNLGKFLTQSFNQAVAVLDALAMNLLLTYLANRTKDQQILLIIDSTVWERSSLAAIGCQKVKMTSGGFGKGSIVVVAILRIGECSVPLALEIVLNKTWAKALNRPRRTQNQIAMEMIKAFQPPHGIPVTVLFDSFFASQQLLRTCDNKGFTFVTNLKKNRKVRAHKPLHQVGQYASNVLSHTKRVVRVNGHSFFVAERRSYLPGVGHIWLTFSRKPDHKRIFHLVSNSFLAAHEMIALYLKRWAIECFFKDVKHHLGFGRYPARTLEGASNHMHLVLMAHALLTFLRFKSQEKGKLKNANASSVSEIRSDLRTKLQAHFIHHTLRRQKLPANFDLIMESLRVAS